MLQRCPETFTGRRNRALLLVMADSGLRVSEVLHLLEVGLPEGGRPVAVQAVRLRVMKTSQPGARVSPPFGYSPGFCFRPGGKRNQGYSE